jgi:toxin ParE1/3/4
MTRIVISPRADADVDDIVNYLARRGGISVVQRYLEAFDAVYARLEQFPGSGPSRSRLGPLSRVAVVSPYVIIYDWGRAADTVIVLRVVRGSRKITRKLAQAKN